MNCERVEGAIVRGNKCTTEIMCKIFEKDVWRSKMGKLCFQTKVDARTDAHQHGLQQFRNQNTNAQEAEDEAILGELA